MGIAYQTPVIGQAHDLRNTVVEILYGSASSSCRATHYFHYDEKSISWALQCPDRDCWGLSRPLGHIPITRQEDEFGISFFGVHILG